MNDRLPPNSPDLEASFLSACIQSPVRHLPIVASKITDECFYDHRHKIIWNILKTKLDRSECIDLVTITGALKESKLFDKIGGFEFLNNLEQLCPSPENISDYADQLIEFFKRRRILKLSIELTRRVSDGESTDSLGLIIEDLADQSKASNLKLYNGSGAGDLMIGDLSRRFDLNGKLSGIDTGFSRLNRMTDGIQYAEHTVIGARPSMGKTAIGLNIFQHAVFNLNVHSLFISLEMSVEALMKRMLSSKAGIEMSEIRRGTYCQQDFMKFAAFNSQCKLAPMHIIDGTSGLGISSVVNAILDFVRRFGVKLVVIDYLQKIKPGGKHEKRTYEVADVSEKLKAVSIETGVALLSLAQLNRESEKEKGKAPKISDLADSGQIERDADTIMLIHRDRMDPNGATKLIVGKQRDGEVGFVDLVFNGRFCRFENPES